MNIIVFSNDAWDDTNATGNTLSNFFGGTIWSKDVFYNMYMRSAKPNNKICKNYYCILLTDLIKNFFHKEKIGFKFCYDNNFNNKELNKIKEKKMIDLIHKYSINFVYLIADYLYRKKLWINSNFINFVKDVKPDIFYAHMNNFAMLKPIIQYLKKNTSAKIVLLLTDDLYGDINNKSIFRRKKLKKDYEDIICMSDQLYGVSKEICIEYGKIFKKDIKLLYKGCSFDYSLKTKLNDTIKFVYAGNLFYGRDDTLSKIAQAIDKSNKKNKKKAILEIYTGTTITPEIEKKLNIDGSSVIVGKKDYDEIKKIMNNAEYNLHVESFEQKQIDYVKYSFSTKIIDCLQAGSSVLAIGPNNVSSINYFDNIPGVHTITNINNIEKEIFNLINNEKKILDDAKKIRNYAIKNHNLSIKQDELRQDFCILMNSKKVKMK